MTEDPFAPFRKLYDSFGNFRTRRDQYQSFIDGTDTILLGNPYHDVGLRHHSIRPAFERDQYTAILDTAGVTFAFEARTDDEKDIAGASKSEEWANAAIPLLRAGKTDPLRLSRSRRAGIGVDVWKLDLRNEWFTNETGLPFIWSSIDPKTCAWFEDVEGMQLMVEMSLRPINPILQAFGMRYKDGMFLDLGEGAPVERSPEHYLETVEFTQVSTPETIMFFVEQKGVRGGRQPAKLLKTFENPWRKVPYVIVPALLTSNTTDPAKRYQALIHNAVEVARYENFMRSLLFLAAKLTAAPIYDLVTKGTQALFLDEETGDPIKLEVDGDKPVKFPLPEGTELKQRTIQMGVDARVMLDMLAAEADRVGFPTGLLGTAPEPRTPAYALAERAGQASVFIDPAVRAEEAALLELWELMAGCIKNYDGFVDKEIPILVRVEDESGKPETLTLGPGDIGEYDVRVHAAPVISSLDMAQKEVDRKDVAEGHMSQRTYMTRSGVKDVDKELRQIGDEKLMTMLEPSTLAHSIQVINAKAQRRLGSPIPVPEGVPPPEMPEVQGRTRAAQQVRSTESQPNPAEQVPV